jgi:uncharacterized protein YcaQ
MLGRSGSAELWVGTTPAPTRARLLADLVEDGALVPVAIDGVRGERFILAEERGLLEAGGIDPGSRQVAFLPPLDPFVWDRDFLRSLYDFDYVWEVYVPLARRRWGYYVLPILFGDRLVGRIEPRVDRPRGVLRVLGLWWEQGFDPITEAGFVDAFVDALQAHAGFLDAERIVLPGFARHRILATAIRARLGTRGRLRS